MSPRLVHMAIFYRFKLCEGLKFTRLPFAVSRIKIFHNGGPWRASTGLAIFIPVLLFLLGLSTLA